LMAMTPNSKRKHDAEVEAEARREASWSSWLASYAGSTMFKPTRLLGRGLMRLGSCPLDATVGIAAAVSSPSELSPVYEGKRVMAVGGTRGIGRAIVCTLREAGAHVTVVGRSAVPFAHVTPKASPDCEAFAADLSTTVGCRKLVSEVAAAGVQPFHYLVFTVGAWPDFADPYTSEGVEKVVALDLLARHFVLEGLAAAGLLASGGRVLNVLASAQLVPFITAESIRVRVAAVQPPATMFTALMPVGVAADAWLQDAARRHPSLSFVGMFPGVLPTELASSTFPSWALPALTAAMLPVASSAEEVGLAHATVLASPNAGRRRVSYFNHLLEGRASHPLAYAPELGAWITSHLEEVAARVEEKARPKSQAGAPEAKD